ncbi:hypothetical protein HUJ05_006645 [Dendroctonus ponderosae]|nr:hypothetical protein HUJ05_006645 [Dendroctonus ponderosae]
MPQDSQIYHPQPSHIRNQAKNIQERISELGNLCHDLMLLATEPWKSFSDLPTMISIIWHNKEKINFTIHANAVKAQAAEYVEKKQARKAAMTRRDLTGLFRSQQIQSSPSSPVPPLSR